MLMAVGGALGGVFNALISPLIFSSIAEYPIAILLACALCPPRQPLSSWICRRDIIVGIVPALAVVLLSFVVESLLPTVGMTGSVYGNLTTTIVIALPLIACYLLMRRPVRFALALGGWFLASHMLYEQTKGDLLFAERSFYGVHRVTYQPEYQARVLRHGFTAHGMQKSDPDLQSIGTTYYHPSGPVGQIFSQFGAELDTVGIVGLGAGTIASFAGRGSNFIYYEIDPVVETIAEDETLFTYLRDARARGATITNIIGDARLTLAQEPDNSLDLLIIDAFSSASIPVHLMTKEALTLYLEKLKPNGLLLFHVSNKSLNVGRPLAGLADNLGLNVMRQDNKIESRLESHQGKFASQWVVMSRDQTRLSRLPQSPARWRALQFHGEALWTDDFSNIIQLISTN